MKSHDILRARESELPWAPTVRPPATEYVPRRQLASKRIASHLAPLCGIPNPAVGHGRTFLLNYSDMKMQDIAWGTPNRTKDRASYRDGPVSDNCTKKLGPDAKSATILTGVNALLKSRVSEQEATYKEIGYRLAPELRLGVAACLAFQVFRGQPQLFATGTQAWRIQRSLLHDNLEAATPEDMISYYSEHPRRPDTFNILDQLAQCAPVEISDRVPDVFADTCLRMAQHDNILLPANSSDEPLLRAVFDPGEAADHFLAQLGMDLSAAEQAKSPWHGKPEGTYTDYMAAWAVNDLNRRTLPPERQTDFLTANQDILPTLRQF